LESFGENKEMLKENRSGHPVWHVLAGVLLIVPVVAYLWVPSYAKASPRVANFRSSTDGSCCGC
jgi:hypothetical protein